MSEIRFEVFIDEQGTDPEAELDGHDYESRFAIMYDNGVPIAFFLMNILGSAADELEFLRRPSVYGLHNPVEVATGGPVLGSNLLFAGIILSLFIGAVAVFKRKRLSL